jgi:hypothetical protein
VSGADAEHPLKPIRAVGFMVGLPIIVAVVSGLALDVELHDPAQYYATCAQVIATLFVVLAATVVVLPRVLEGRDHVDAYTSAFGLGVLGQTLIGLGFSLVGLATGCSSALLSIGAAATIAAQVLAGAFFGFAEARSALAERGSSGSGAAPTRPKAPAKSADTPIPTTTSPSPPTDQEAQGAEPVDPEDPGEGS